MEGPTRHHTETDREGHLVFILTPGHKVVTSLIRIPTNQNDWGVPSVASTAGRADTTRRSWAEVGSVGRTTQTEAVRTGA